MGSDKSNLRWATVLSKLWGENFSAHHLCLIQHQYSIYFIEFIVILLKGCSTAFYGGESKLLFQLGV